MKAMSITSLLSNAFQILSFIHYAILTLPVRAGSQAAYDLSNKKQLTDPTLLAAGKLITFAHSEPNKVILLRQTGLLPSTITKPNLQAYGAVSLTDIAISLTDFVKVEIKY